jgi:hypothetical protein
LRNGAFYLTRGGVGLSVETTYKIAGKIMGLNILIFMFLDLRLGRYIVVPKSSRLTCLRVMVFYGKVQVTMLRPAWYPYNIWQPPIVSSLPPTCRLWEVTVCL